MLETLTTSDLPVLASVKRPASSVHKPCQQSTQAGSSGESKILSKDLHLYRPII